MDTLVVLHEPHCPETRRYHRGQCDSCEVRWLSPSFADVDVKMPLM